MNFVELPVIYGHQISITRAELPIGPLLSCKKDQLNFWKYHISRVTTWKCVFIFYISAFTQDKKKAQKEKFTNRVIQSSFHIPKALSDKANNFVLNCVSGDETSMNRAAWLYMWHALLNGERSVCSVRQNGTRINSGLLNDLTPSFSLSLERRNVDKREMERRLAEASK